MKEFQRTTKQDASKPTNNETPHHSGKTSRSKPLKPIELALKYLDTVFSGQDPEALNPLFDRDLLFEGPFYRFNSAHEYIDALKKDPPVGFEYDLINAYESGETVCLIYQFSKPGISVPMAQTFDFEGGKISKIRLIFDSAPFCNRD